MIVRTFLLTHPLTIREVTREMPATTRNVHSKFVQELLGHTSVAITLDTYSHMLPGMGGEAANAISEALG